MTETKDFENFLKSSTAVQFSFMEPRDFVSVLEEDMEKAQMTRSSLIQNTLLDRTYAYQIFSGRKIPSKKKVIQIALALGLSVPETNRLLALCDHGSLYARIPQDAVYLYCLYHGKSVLECNTLLYSRNLPLLDQ